MATTAAQKIQGAPAGWLAELDGLRCLAALAVALVHYTPVTAPVNSVPALLRHYGGRFAIANIIVAFFYGLSAFLLTYIELKRRQLGHSMNVPRFYLRRTLRIWPLYFFMVAFGFLVSVPGVFSAFAREDVRVGRRWGLEHTWMYLTFTSNWSLAFDGIGAYADRAMSNLQILWSIAVEEQFYLLFPALLLLCFRKPRFWIKLVSAAAVLGVGSRIALIWAGELFRGSKPAGYIYYSTLSYLEVFAAGALAAAVVAHAETFNRARILFGRRSLGLALAAALTATGWLWSSYLFPPYSRTPRALFQMRDWAITVAIYPMVGLLIAAILIWINVNTHSIVSRFLRTRLMRSLGTLSFGIYMWHPLVQPVIQAMDAHYVATMPACMAGVNLLFLLYVSLTVACAGLSYFMVEGPVLRWKERFAGHTGGNSPNRAQDEGRGPIYVFPGAVAAAAVSAILLSGQLLRSAESGAALPPATAPQVSSLAARVGSNLQKPQGPARLTAERKAATSTMLVRWNPLEDIERYELEITELRPDSAVFAHVVGAPGANNSYGVGNISQGSANSFQIRGCRASNCSDWSTPAVSMASRRDNR